MLYMIENTYTPALINGELEDLHAAEHAMLKESYADGTLLRIWRKASGEGAVLVVNVADPGTLTRWIRSIPMLHGFETLKITPLTTNPLFPQFCEPDADR